MVRPFAHLGGEFLQVLPPGIRIIESAVGDLIGGMFLKPLDDKGSGFVPGTLIRQ